MHMKTKYTLFRRGGIYYSQDSASGQQKSLRTRDETEALKLINARNEAHRQAPCNFPVHGSRLMEKFAECDESLHDPGWRRSTIFSISRVKESTRRVQFRSEE